VTAEIAELAIDTSVLRELHADGPRAAVIRQLLNLAQAGKILLVARSGITDEVPDVRIADLPIKLVSSNPIEFGIDVDRADPSLLRELTLGDQHFESQFADTQMLAASRLPTRGAPGSMDWRDWDHLHFHLVNGRRHFVTLDTRILSVALDFGERFGMRVLTPEEAVDKFA
jgi:hypothetical protein